MDTLVTVTALLASTISAFCFGSLLMLLGELKEARAALRDKVAEFSEITRGASEANQTHAMKMLQLEDRVASAEQKVAFWNAQQTTTSGAQWGTGR